MGFKIKKTGIDAALEELEQECREAGTLTTVEKPKTEKEKAQDRRSTKGFVEPEKAKDIIKILFDDSGSMAGQKLADAKAGSVEFMRNCQINQVALGIYPFNTEAIAPDTDLPDVGALTQHIKATGSTPMFETLEHAMREEIRATRYIIFTDGQPDNNNKMNELIEKAQADKTPIDTVWIYENRSYSYSLDSPEIKTYPEYILLKSIADATGGFFLIFDRNKVNFTQAFKFLAPGNRLMLASESFRNDLQAGKIR